MTLDNACTRHRTFLGPISVKRPIVFPTIRHVCTHSQDEGEKQSKYIQNHMLEKDFAYDEVPARYLLTHSVELCAFSVFWVNTRDAAHVLASVLLPLKSILVRVYMLCIHRRSPTSPRVPMCTQCSPKATKKISCYISENMAQKQTRIVACA